MQQELDGGLIRLDPKVDYVGNLEVGVYREEVCRVRVHARLAQNRYVGAVCEWSRAWQDDVLDVGPMDLDELGLLGEGRVVGAGGTDIGTLDVGVLVVGEDWAGMEVVEWGQAGRFRVYCSQSWGVRGIEVCYPRGTVDVPVTELRVDRPIVLPRAK